MWGCGRNPHPKIYRSPLLEGSFFSALIHDYVRMMLWCKDNIQQFDCLARIRSGLTPINYPVPWLIGRMDLC